METFFVYSKPCFLKVEKNCEHQTLEKMFVEGVKETQRLELTMKCTKTPTVSLSSKVQQKFKKKFSIPTF